MKVGPPPDEEDGRERQRGRDSTPLHLYCECILAERKEERKMTPPTHLKSDCALHRGIRGVITRKSRDLSTVLSESHPLNQNKVKFVPSIIGKIQQKAGSSCSILYGCVCSSLFLNFFS